MPYSSSGDPQPYTAYDTANLAMTYTALAALAILGDDFGRVDKEGIASALRYHQQPDGGFASVVEGGEKDMRFMYCACSIAYMLNDWRGIDVPLAISHIRSAFAPGGGFGQDKGLEAHGGSTYCAVASLWLMVLTLIIRGTMMAIPLTVCLYCC